jgi:hypothetical protein
VSARDKATDSLRRIAERLEAEGLRPIVDAVLQVVRADCPECHAAQSDPLELWRPLIVVPRPRGTKIICESCEASHVG